MAEQETQSPPNPFDAWRDWLGQSERQFNEFFKDLMGTENFSRTVGFMLESYVTMQKVMAEQAERYFSTFNLPSRRDVLALGERLAAVETQLEAIKSLVESQRGAGAFSGNGAGGRARPRRTRKPPAAV